jgi:hypothetical protein
MRLPHVVGNLIPPELEGRVTLTTHDFFTPQPITADIYYFRWISHNWSNVYAIKILQNLVSALKPGAKILINDGILPNLEPLVSWKKRVLGKWLPRAPSSMQLIIPEIWISCSLLL